MRTRSFSSEELSNISKNAPINDRDTLSKIQRSSSPLMQNLAEDDPEEVEFRRRQMEDMNPQAFGKDFVAGNELRNNPRGNQPTEAVVIPPQRTETKPTPVYAKKTETQDDSSWIRQEVPSHCVPYIGRNDVFIKAIDWGQLGMLSSASKQKSTTMMIDALAKSVRGVDIRDLTPSDFSFLMYNIRNISYPTTKMQVAYTTRYGNEVMVPVNLNELDIIELAMTPEEYKVYYDQGIQFPTVRDLEILFDPDLDDELKFTLEYAQYMRLDDMEDDIDFSDYIERKIAKLNEKGVEFTKIIDEFAIKATHGVKEEVKIRDPKFDPLKAAKLFEDQATNMVRGMNALVSNNKIDSGREAPAVAIMLIASELMEESRKLKERVEKGEKVEAEEETVAVMITATDFFPYL